MDFSKIWLLAHAIRSQSKRLGACFFSLKLFMPYAGNLDLQISVIFGNWLTPFGPGESGQALTCMLYFISVRFGFWLAPFDPGVSA